MNVLLHVFLKQFFNFPITVLRRDLYRRFIIRIHSVGIGALLQRDPDDFAKMSFCRGVQYGFASYDLIRIRPQC